MGLFWGQYTKAACRVIALGLKHPEINIATIALALLCGALPGRQHLSVHTSNGPAQIMRQGSPRLVFGLANWMDNVTGLPLQQPGESKNAGWAYAGRVPKPKGDTLLG